MLMLTFSFALCICISSTAEVLPKLGVVLRSDLDSDYRIVLDIIHKNIVRNQNADQQRFQPFRQILVEASDATNVSALSRKICSSMFRYGDIIAVTTAPDLALTDTVESVVREYNVPFLRVFPSTRTVHDQSFNFFNNTIQFFPDYEIVNDAILDVINFFEWKHLFILYESLYDLMSLSTLFGARNATNITINMSRLKEKPLDNFHLAKRLRYKNFLINVPRSNVVEVMTAAMQLSLIDSDYNFIINILDGVDIDLSNFSRSECRIILFQLRLSSDHESALNFTRKHASLMNVAYFYDTVMAFLGGQQKFNEDRKSSFQFPKCVNQFNGFPEAVIPCSNITDIRNSIINNMPAEGLTGRKIFKGNIRVDLAFEIHEYNKSGLQDTIGSWDNNNLHNYPEKKLEINERLPHFVITTIGERPYVFKHDNSNDSFDGFCIDFIKYLVHDLKFTYEIKLVEDGKYGAPLPNGRWDGMIGEILSGQADWAVAPLTVNSKRAEMVDFTTPFLSFGIALLFKIPSEEFVGIFSFMNPLSSEIWYFIIVSVAAVTIMMFCTARVSPYEWRKMLSCSDKVRGQQMILNKFTLANTLWYTTSTLLRGASDDGPKAVSTRTLGAFWWIFTLVMTSAYTANLAAVLAVSRQWLPISSVNDLSNNSEIAFGAIRDGSTMQFFNESEVEEHQAIFSKMSQNDDWLVHRNNEGVERVLEGDYAYLMESISLEYEVEQNCNLTQVGGVLGLRGYGIALRKGSEEWKEKLTRQILQYQENGTLDALKTKWWKYSGKSCVQTDGGSGSAVKWYLFGSLPLLFFWFQISDHFLPNHLPHSPKGSAKATMKKGKVPLSIRNVAGIFLILSAGLFLAIVIGCVEFLCKRNRQDRFRTDLRREIVSDLRFAMRQDRYRPRFQSAIRDCEDCLNSRAQSRSPCTPAAIRRRRSADFSNNEYCYPVADHTYGFATQNELRQLHYRFMEERQV